MSRKYKFHNPVEEALVFKPEQYVYSSAIDYAGEKRLLGHFRLRFRFYNSSQDLNFTTYSTCFLLK